MEIKYLDKTILYQNKQKTYNKVKQFVEQRFPQLKTKKWTFTYFDSEGDQVILGDNDDFQSTIDYYNSIQKELILIVKQMWWKHKKVHSKSKIVKQLLNKKSLDFEELKMKSFKISDSDSDDQFINIELRPGQLYVDDSDQHNEADNEQKPQAISKQFSKDKLAEKSDLLYKQVQKAQLKGCSGQTFQLSIQNKELLQTKPQVINP